MIEVTERAALAMNAALRKARARGVRLEAVGKKAAAYRLTLEDGPRKSDLILESQGVRLYVDASDREKVAGVRIDYLKDRGVEGFTLRVPGGCGCGPGCACGG